MRHVVVAIVAAIAVGFGAGPVQADKVEVKGVHLCCGQCVKAMGGILGKVEGVSEAKCDQKGGVVTFTAKDEKAAAAGFKAMMDGGFFGTATRDGKDMKVDPPAKADKADTVTVKDVHSCCGMCRKGITAMFKDAKVSFDGPGPQQTVKIEGKGLNPADVLATFRKAGLNGTIAK
jgi:bacterioferritin-associated ferredoxin